MSSNKTIETTASVKDFLKTVPVEQQRQDSKTLMKIMEKIVGDKAKMWGDSLVGFGKYHYQYASGREGDFFLTGFSPRKSNLSIYILAGFENFEKELARLGKHKTARACLYVKKLDDVDLDILEQIIRDSVATIRERYTWFK